MDKMKLVALYKRLNEDEELKRQVMCIKRDMKKVYDKISVIAEQEKIEITSEDFIELFNEIQYKERCK